MWSMFGVGAYTYMALVTAIDGFNIETRGVKVLSPANVQKGSWFGHSIALQPVRPGQLTAYISAPLHENIPRDDFTVTNGTLQPADGAIYKCSVSGNVNTILSCTRRSFGENSASGMTMLHVSKDKLMVCGPQWKYLCRNTKLPIRMVGRCFVVNSTDFTEDDPTPIPSPCITDCPGGLDIIYLLDSSGSVKPDDFETAKKWLVSTISGFSEGMAHGDVHVGFIQYSATTTSSQCEDGILTRLISIELSLGRYNLSYVNETVMKTQPFSRCTLTGDSINVTVDEFIAHGRKENAAVMIVITDGKSSDKVTGASNRAKNHGINMIAIGVGSKINKTELGIIANDNASVFTVADFASLNSILTSLQEAIVLVSSTTLEGKAANSTSNLTQCLMGMSSTLSEDKTLYLGATGACDSKGTVISRKLDKLGNITVPPESDVKELLDGGETRIKDSYLGYSMTTGYFLGKEKKEWIVAGIPRYLGYGAVAVYKGSNTGFQDHHLILSAKDIQAVRREIGSYFGHTLSAIDINNDGADELLVGAPLHSNRGSASYDEGCVMIYSGNTSAIDVSYMREPWCTLQGFQQNSRFGMSISRAGDLDRDSYQDFVVGAPGYDDLQGEIVAFFGDSGCPTRYQRISPSTLGISLQYFGFFVSVVDDPLYSSLPTLIATSPKTQSLVLLRARPVIDLTAELSITKLSGERIGSLNVVKCAKDQSVGISCAVLQACFDIAWRDALQMTSNGDVEISFEIILDADFQDADKRMVFAKTSEHTLKVTNHTLSTQRECQKYSLILRPNLLTQVAAVNFSESVGISLLVRLSDSLQASEMSPVLSTTKVKLRTVLNFEKGCRTNGNCQYDFVLEADMTAENHIKMYEASEMLTVNLTILNRGDPAFFTKVYVESKNADISKISSDCAYLENDRETIAFRDSILGSLFAPNHTCKVEITFSLLKMAKHANETVLEVNATVFSLLSEKVKATDVTLENNAITVRKNIIYFSAIEIKSISLPAEIQYWRNISRRISFTSLTQKGIFAGEDGALTNLYTVRNTGPFTIPSADMMFTWPAFTVEQEFPILYMFKIECKPASACSCNLKDQCGLVNPWKLPYDNFNTTSQIRQQSQCQPELNLSEPTSVKFVLPKKYLFASEKEVVCSGINSSFRCHNLSCHLTNVKPQEVVELQARFKMWIPTFHLKKQNPRVYVGTRLKLNLTKSAVFPTVVYSRSAVTSTYQYFSRPKPKVHRSLDVVLSLVAILIGLAIIGIATLICWKCGFFESKYKKMRKEFQPSKEEREVIATIAAAEKISHKRKRKTGTKRQSSLIARIHADENVSLMNASQEFLAAIRSQSKEKLTVKDDLYLEMTPMKMYRAEKAAFQSNVKQLTLPRRDVKSYESPIHVVPASQPTSSKFPAIQIEKSSPRKNPARIVTQESGYSPMRPNTIPVIKKKSSQPLPPLPPPSGLTTRDDPEEEAVYFQADAARSPESPSRLVSPSTLFPNFSFAHAEEREGDIKMDAVMPDQGKIGEETVTKL